MKNFSLKIFILLFFCGVVFAEDFKSDLELYRSGVHEIIKQYALDIKTEQTGNKVVYKYHVRQYMVYPIEKSGRIGNVLLEQIGPDFDGFIIELRTEEGDFAGQMDPMGIDLDNPRDSLKTLEFPYWRSQVTQHHFKNRGTTVILNVSYNNRTDLKLLKLIVDKFNEVTKILDTK